MNQIISRVVAAMVLSSVVSQAAFAQGTMTLRDPLIPGAQSTGAWTPPSDGAPPPVGDGPTSLGVTPGMGGAPTPLPWVPAIPANQLGLQNSGINLPIAPSIVSPPGILGPEITQWLPKSAAPPSVLGPQPSAPGAPGGMLQLPPYEANPGDFTDAQQVPVDDNGAGLPGTGGYGTSVSQNRRGGQQTHQWGGTYANATRHRAFGTGSGAKGDVQDEVARVGALAGFGLPFGVPTGNGFDKGTAAGGDMRNSSIDLGGGQRMKVGGTTISTGSSVQDFGLSDTRNNSIPALKAQQSTDFGQGFRNMVKQGLIQANATTDFGIPYQQFKGANLNGTQKTGQRLQPQAIETNF
jgi:hypothetical protein